MDGAEASLKRHRLHACDDTQAGVDTALRFFPHHSFGERSLFVLLFMASKKVCSSELSLAIGCHGDTRQPGVMACEESSAQVKSKEVFIRLAPLSSSPPPSNLNVICFIEMRYSNSLLAATATPKYKKTSHQGFKSPCCPSAFH